jgi:NTP pyrophosphatase (non-canonical NTP hydrolase)
MEISKLIEESHKVAVEHGFWDIKCPICKGVPTENNDCEFCGGKGLIKARDENDFNVAEKLMLCVSELAEAMEALRKNHRADLEAYYSNLIFPSNKEKDLFEKYIKNSFCDEIADTFIRLGDLCGMLKIDITPYIHLKMAYNKNRSYKHGKKF